MAFRLVQDKFGDVAGDFTVQQLTEAAGRSLRSGRDAKATSFYVL